MKKIFLLALLCILCRGSYAQNKSLNISNNSNAICGVYVTMHAISAAYPTCCDILANQIYLAPGASVSYANCNAFETAVGWFIPAIPFTSPLPPYALNFQWTDVNFQFNCPLSTIPPCANGGTFVNGLGPTCYLPSTPTIASAGFPGCMTATWSPGTTFPVPYQNVTITFN